ncbi:hypothetical protein CEUSTIGMA_g4263.t1 [Chlamydomonas eustigma]|uniref:Uncharacterized protein n=1 Tax=Chlamydomonas eustigma TaxID=1157962 RepID=A0A250X161_9CHLO|nr:hypothetical protein CEUSTIGMA_g4263.t1 [Chlamydomonas eustigma]|eukprot:GAX76817.1 hypothetical protein CEUSTIGMA_g4263.t1 [Chlamydomonas eustigma]
MPLMNSSIMPSLTRFIVCSTSSSSICKSFLSITRSISSSSASQIAAAFSIGPGNFCTVGLLSPPSSMSPVATNGSIGTTELGLVPSAMAATFAHKNRCLLLAWEIDEEDF